MTRAEELRRVLQGRVEFCHYVARDIAARAELQFLVIGRAEVACRAAWFVAHDRSYSVAEQLVVTPIRIEAAQ